MQNDITAITDSAGKVIANYYYDAWGNIEITGNTDIANINPLRYRSYYYDAETGYYYLNSRYYVPDMYRFLNADYDIVPTIDITTLTDKNIFAYCDNNPVIRADDGGKFWHLVIGAAVGGLASGISDALTSYFQNGSVDIKSALLSTAIGAVSGLVGASGLGLGLQLAIGGALGGVSSLSSQLINQGSLDLSTVDWIDVGISAGIGVITSAISYKVTAKASTSATKEINKGAYRMIKGQQRNFVNARDGRGAIKQGQRVLTRGLKNLHTARGKSSVISSGLNGAFTTVKSFFNKLFGD